MNTLKVVFIKTLRWLTVFSYMVVIFVFSSQEAYKSDSFSVGITSFVVKTLGLSKLIYRENSVYEIDYNTIFSKTAHIMEFFILTVLLYMVLKLYRLKSERALVMIFSICAIYAIADEFHQKFVYGRGASIVDTLVDICGCFIGILSILLLGNLRNRIRSFKGQKIINGK